jgi:hypothetical protein
MTFAEVVLIATAAIGCFALGWLCRGALSEKRAAPAPNIEHLRKGWGP